MTNDSMSMNFTSLVREAERANGLPIVGALALQKNL